jgi:hypothetical protein
MWAVAMIVMAVTMTFTAITTTMMIGVHGWVLPPSLQHQHSCNKPLLPLRPTSTTEGGSYLGGGICFQKGNRNFNRNHNHNHNHNHAGGRPKNHPATPTDDEDEGECKGEQLEGSMGGGSGVATNHVFPVSETERKDLVDALFKGSSSSGNDNDNGIGIGIGNDNVQEQQELLLEKIDDFLDKPFFDPDAYDETDDSFFGKIANFVRADYELFEAIFVACFFLLLVSITKDLLRAQMAASGVVASGKIF